MSAGGAKLRSSPVVRESMATVEEGVWVAVVQRLSNCTVRKLHESMAATYAGSQCTALQRC